MFKLNNQFIFQNSPEMGQEQVVQNESAEELKEIPSGAEMVDIVARALDQKGAENYSADEIKKFLGITEQDTGKVDNIGRLLEAMV